MSTPEKPKYFTIEEANQALPLVRAIVADIVRQYRAISDRKELLDQVQKSRSGKDRRPNDPYGEEIAQVEEQLEKDVSALQEYVEELENLGVELKDVGRGLVDFRALIDGREVYLCWQLGEDEIAFWHELDAGFAGRQSLLARTHSGEISDDETTTD